MDIVKIVVMAYLVINVMGVIYELIWLPHIVSAEIKNTLDGMLESYDSERQRNIYYWTSFIVGIVLSFIIWSPIKMTHLYYKMKDF